MIRRRRRVQQHPTQRHPNCCPNQRQTWLTCRNRAQLTRLIRH